MSKYGEYFFVPDREAVPNREMYEEQCREQWKEFQAKTGKRLGEPSFYFHTHVPRFAPSMDYFESLHDGGEALREMLADGLEPGQLIDYTDSVGWKAEEISG